MGGLRVAQAPCHLEMVKPQTINHAQRLREANLLDLAIGNFAADILRYVAN